MIYPPEEQVEDLKIELNISRLLVDRLTAENQRLTERLEWLQGILNRQAIETEGLAEALGACSQARAELLDRVRGVK
jgi:post-segregation antitoxin (ccd killing protein)